MLAIEWCIEPMERLGWSKQTLARLLQGTWVDDRV